MILIFFTLLLMPSFSYAQQFSSVHLGFQMEKPTKSNNMEYFIPNLTISLLKEDEGGLFSAKHSSSLIEMMNLRFKDTDLVQKNDLEGTSFQIKLRSHNDEIAERFTKYFVKNFFTCLSVLDSKSQTEILAFATEAIDMKYDRFGFMSNFVQPAIDVMTDLWHEDRCLGTAKNHSTYGYGKLRKMLKYLVENKRPRSFTTAYQKIWSIAFHDLLFGQRKGFWVSAARDILTEYLEESLVDIDLNRPGERIFGNHNSFFEFALKHRNLLTSSELKTIGLRCVGQSDAIANHFDIDSCIAEKKLSIYKVFVDEDHFMLIGEP